MKEGRRDTGGRGHRSGWGRVFLWFSMKEGRVLRKEGSVARKDDKEGRQGWMARKDAKEGCQGRMTKKEGRMSKTGR